MLTQKYIKLTPYAHINHYFSKEAVASQPFFGSLQALNQSFSNEAVLYVYIYSSATGRALKSDAEKNGQTYYWHYTTIEIDEQGNYYQTENGRSRTKIETIQITTSVGDGAVPVTNYCCISRIAFSDERIKELCVKLAESSGTYKRFEEIKIYEAAKSRNNYYVKVTEPMYVAQELSKKYRENYEKYIEWISDPQRMSLKRLNDMIVKVVEGNTKYASCLESGFKQNYINFNNPVLCPYTRWRDEYFRELEVLTTACNESCSILCQWLDGESFNLMLDDYLKDDASKDLGEKEFELCTRYVNQEKVGIEYLQRIVDNKNHWVWQTVFEATRIGIEATWSILSLFVTHKISADGSSYTVWRFMYQYIIDTLNNRYSDGYVWIIDNDNILKIDTLDGKTHEIRMPRLRAKKNNRVLNSLEEIKINVWVLSLVDFLNIALAMYSLNENGYMTSENKELLAFSISNIISNGIIISQKLITNLISRPSGLVSSSALFMGSVTGYISIMLRASDIVDAIAVNDYGDVAGNGIIILGGIFSIVSACYTAATITAGTGVLTPGALILGTIGVFLSIIGTLISLFTQDNPIEAYLKHCIWGDFHETSNTYWVDELKKLTSLGQHIFLNDQYNRSKITEQIRVLNNIIFSISCNSNKERDNNGTVFYIITATTRILPQTKLYFCLWYVEENTSTKSVKVHKRFVVPVTRNNFFRREGFIGGYTTKIEFYIYDETTSTRGHHGYGYHTEIDEAIIKERNLQWESVNIPSLNRMIRDDSNPFNKKSIRYLLIADTEGDGTIYIPSNHTLINSLNDLLKNQNLSGYLDFPGIENTFALHDWGI